MGRRTRHDAAKAKAAKQKKIAIGGGVLLVAILGFQVPRTMKMLHQHPSAPVTDASATTPPAGTATTPAPTDPNSLAAPSLAGTPPAATTPAATAPADLVAAVPMSADPGQLETFARFATKDPFVEQVSPDGSPSTGGSGSGSGSGSHGSAGSSGSGGTPAPSPPPRSPAPAPSSAVISVNGELMQVPSGSDFPTGGATFARSGSLFHLVSLTAKTAKVSIAGGSYADGASAITLQLRQPVTLQNTADGTKYTLILEPPGTPVTATSPAAPAPAAPAPAAPATTTPASVVPTSGSGG